MPGRTWRRLWALAQRIKTDIIEDRVTLLSAGIAFYAFLALFPALAALVSIWGLFADPAEVELQIAGLQQVPESVRDLLTKAATPIAGGSASALGWTTAVSLAFTLWSANKGVKGLVQGIAIAYGAKRRRGYIRLNALALALTFGGIVVVAVVLGLVLGLPTLLRGLGAEPNVQLVAWIARWPVLGGMVLFALAFLYRVAPQRSLERYRFVTPGSAIATVAWLIVSVLFSTWAENFGEYDKVYGSVASVAITLYWFYISAFIVLLGAEVDADLDNGRAGERPRAFASERATRPPPAAGHAPTFH